MEKMEINCRLYRMTRETLNEMALELLMRSMREREKNIWRVDYDLLREEIKATFFYAPALSADLMKGMKKGQALSMEVRAALLLGLVMRNPHWSIVEEEFLSLYGSLQMGSDFLFEDYPLLAFLHRVQHRGDLGAASMAESLEQVKLLETKRILGGYKPLAFKALADSKKMLQIEKSRVRWIQGVMAEKVPLVPEALLAALEEPCDQSGEAANRWRVMMDKLQRRERTGWSAGEIQRAKKGQGLNHQLLGPLQVTEVIQKDNHQRVRLKGLLREYVFQYEKKR